MRSKIIKWDVKYPKGAIQKKSELEIGKSYYLTWEYRRSPGVSETRKYRLHSILEARGPAPPYTYRIEMMNPHGPYTATFWLSKQGTFIPAVYDIGADPIGFLFDNYWYCYALSLKYKK